MSGTHSLGGHFVATKQLAADSPRRSRATVYEVEDPFRTGKATLFRLFGTRGVMVGRWGVKLDPDDHDEIQHHLLRAMKSAAGTDSFLEGSRENWEIQNSRQEAGESPVHPVAHEDYIQ